MEVCESVEQCVELVHIDLSSCYKLKKFPIGKLKKVQTLLLNDCNLSESTIMDSSDLSVSSQTSSSDIIREAIPSDFKFFMNLLPSSLRILSLANNKLSNESFPMDLSCLAMLEELCLDDNPIVSLPNCVGTLPRIEKLSINHCYDVILVEHLPHTLRVFSMYTYSDSTTRKIKFDPEIPPLKLRGIPGWAASHLSLEYEGIIKIEPMVDVDEKLLHSLGWKKSDFIKGGHLLNHDIQMYYEFGIFSTIYWWKGMPDWIRYRSWGPSISFIIPSSPKKLRGLNFCCVNWSPFTSDTFSMRTIKISNITKKQTWIYKHYSDCTWVDGKDCFSWLSHWMFGPNEMKAGDHIIIECDRFETEWGFGVVYDDGSMEEEEDVLSYYKSWNHIIGGDLSAFQTTTGEYYLNYMEFTREVMFKAFSKKKSEIVESQAQCSSAMPPAGDPWMPMFPHGFCQLMFDVQAQPTLILPQMVPSGLMYRHPPDSNTDDVSMDFVPYDVENVMQLHDDGEISAFAADTSPTEQRTILGENLYSLVELLEAESTAKVNGMLLEMDPTEVLQLLKSPEALKAKVAEAMWVLRNAMPLRVAGVTSALAIASPTERRTILGENLYPLVEQLEAESATKITGMLLEMDTRDVIHLLESPEALKAKVLEAMEVLRNAMPSRVAGVISAFANALPTEERIIFGENLYPVAEQLETESTAKVTEMLMEMDPTTVSQKEGSPADQLATLCSFNHLINCL
ncbi:putative polyadenylate-binding protein/Hyperplastic disc protein [Helianthus annuus]|nr:putative polyadenylate-binding protein/Hyperplastic disc protein [Helianthus annuus]